MLVFILVKMETMLNTYGLKNFDKLEFEVCDLNTKEKNFSFVFMILFYVF